MLDSRSYVDGQQSPYIDGQQVKHLIRGSKHPTDICLRKPLSQPGGVYSRDRLGQNPESSWGRHHAEELIARDRDNDAGSTTHNSHQKQTRKVEAVSSNSGWDFSPWMTSLWMNFQLFFPTLGIFILWDNSSDLLEMGHLIAVLSAQCLSVSVCLYLSLSLLSL